MEMKTKGRTLDNVAYVYDWLSPLMTFGQERRFSKEVLSLIKVNQQNCRILDIGCGTGSLTLDVAEIFKSSTIIGIDAAPKMIEIARKKVKAGNVSFEVAIAENLPYENERFDFVISTFFFHHIDFELKTKALSEIKRVLKTDGKLIIVDVDIPTNWFGKICAWSGYFLFQQPEIKENIDGKLREAIKLAGFESFDIIFRNQGYISTFYIEK